MRTNARGTYCPTPVRKDENGNVLEWCQFGKTESGTQVVPQREELIGKVLANMSVKLDRILEILEKNNLNAVKKELKGDIL